jgi:hypothetical protein
MPDVSVMPALADLKALVTPYPESEFLRSYIRQYAERNPNVTRYW